MILFFATLITAKNNANLYKSYKLFYKKTLPLPMKMIVDYREKSLLECLEKLKTQPQNKEYANIAIETDNLLLGDIHILSSSGNLNTIVERKTTADLLASIRDGRYDEQYLRLSQCSNIPLHNIVFMIEGNSIADKVALSSMASIVFYKGCSLWQTANTMESAKSLLGICKKMERNEVNNKPMYYLQSTTFEKTDIETTTNMTEMDKDKDTAEEDQKMQQSQQQKIQYADYIKEAKKDNISKNNIGHIFLQQIPYCSSATANAIMEKCGGSFYRLLQELEKDKKYLDNVEIVNGSSGKKRKINKNVIKNILEFLIDVNNQQI
jgi:ERCC4-type nuclease